MGQEDGQCRGRAHFQGGQQLPPRPHQLAFAHPHHTTGSQLQHASCLAASSPLQLSREHLEFAGHSRNQIKNCLRHQWIGPSKPVCQMLPQNVALRYTSAFSRAAAPELVYFQDCSPLDQFNLLLNFSDMFASEEVEWCSPIASYYSTKQVILSRPLRKGKENSFCLDLAKARTIHQSEFKPKCKGDGRGHMSANGLRLRRLYFKFLALAQNSHASLSGNSYAHSNPYSCAVHQIKQSIKHFLLPILFLSHKRLWGPTS